MFYPLPELGHLAQHSGFLLLETTLFSAENFESFCFFEPTKTLTLYSDQDPKPFFEQIHKLSTEGLWVAGVLAYELGYILNRDYFAETAYLKQKTPVCTFFVFAKRYTFNHLTGQWDNKLPTTPINNVDNFAEIKNSRFGISAEQYLGKIAQIKAALEAGDTYQVNFTNKLTFDFLGNPFALYQKLKESQPVPYSAFLNLGEKTVLSFSPELFFKLNQQQIVTKPMKGTAPRGISTTEDQKITQELLNNAKSHAENLMIVDLLRNDLGAICKTGSVQTTKLFTVEKYLSLLQLTSTITGELKPHITYAEIIQQLFPCGSVTGAPKLKTMEIIKALEPQPRGTYCGAIGFFGPNQTATFNVPIRTLELQGNQGAMGVGSGIVYDSDPYNEYQECLLKASFLTNPLPAFELFESILWESGEFFLLAEHLVRLGKSADYFDFDFCQEQAIRLLNKHAQELDTNKKYKVKISCNRYGKLQISGSPIEISATATPLRVDIATTTLDPLNRFLYHKTTLRQNYTAAREHCTKAGLYDTIFLNLNNEVCESTIANVFIQKQNKLYTPKLCCGLLPGVYRETLLRAGTATEKVLTKSDLLAADKIFLGNSVRGLIEVTLAIKK